MHLEIKQLKVVKWELLHSKWRLQNLHLVSILMKWSLWMSQLNKITPICSKIQDNSLRKCPFQTHNSSNSPKTICPKWIRHPVKFQKETTKKKSHFLKVIYPIIYINIFRFGNWSWKDQTEIYVDHDLTWYQGECWLWRSCWATSCLRYFWRSIALCKLHNTFWFIFFRKEKFNLAISTVLVSPVALESTSLSIWWAKRINMLSSTRSSASLATVCSPLRF